VDKHIDASNIDFTYDNKQLVLHNVSLSTYQGESVGLVGRNGAGKTTLVRVLLGILYPTKGNIQIFEYNPLDKKEREKIYGQMGYLPEGAQVYPQLTLEQYIELFKTLHEVEDNSIVEELLEMFDLQDVFKKKLGIFSKGMKQKAKLLTILIHSPRLLIMDEPTDGLDIASKEETIEYMRKLKKEGTSMLIATHDPYVVESLCDRIIMINKGEIVFEGTTKQLQDITQNEPCYVIELMKEIEKEKLEEILNNLPNSQKFSIEGATIKIWTDDENLVKDVYKKFVDKGLIVKNFERVLPTFSQAYKNFLEKL
jgi:ABC-type multidrug transport system ATPase subunit